MKEFLLNCYLKAKNFFKEESGATNIIAIILVIIVVIALVGIFRTQLTEIVTMLFDKIKEALNGF